MLVWSHLASQLEENMRTKITVLAVLVVSLIALSMLDRLYTH